MKYRKKPIIIDAARWHENGDHPQDDSTPIKNHRNETWLSEGKIVGYYRHPRIDGHNHCDKCGELMQDHGWIETLEGGHTVCPGDFIITGVKGEHYPCKPDIFAETYEAVA